MQIARKYDRGTTSKTWRYKEVEKFYKGRWTSSKVYTHFSLSPESYKLYSKWNFHEVKVKRFASLLSLHMLFRQVTMRKNFPNLTIIKRAKMRAKERQKNSLIIRWEIEREDERKQSRQKMWKMLRQQINWRQRGRAESEGSLQINTILNEKRQQMKDGGARDKQADLRLKRLWGRPSSRNHAI